MPRIILVLFAIFSSAHLCSGLRAQESLDTSCPRPSPGAAVPEPADLRSHSGVLQVDLTVRNFTQPGGTTRFCYFDANGNQSPTLRLNPGDLLILNLKNDLTDSPRAVPAAAKSHNHDHATAGKNADPCENSTMSLTSTNLHFHGLTVPPVCHQDDVLKTSIQPGDPPFEYRFRIPANEPPGLYWYHPHIHGFTKLQVLGGASGAIIIEGIERANKEVAGLPERVLIIRDQDLAQSQRAAIEIRTCRAKDSYRPRWRLRKQRHRLRQARERPLHQFCARSLSRLSAGIHQDEAAGAPILARAQRLRHHLS